MTCYAEQVIFIFQVLCWDFIFKLVKLEGL